MTITDIQGLFTQGTKANGRRVSAARKFIDALKDSPRDGPFDFRLALEGPLTGVVNVKAVTATPPYWPEFAGVQAGWTPAVGLRALIPPGSTTASGVYYIRETSFDNNAAAVGIGAVKPESFFTYEDKTAPLSTIAHVSRFSRQLLDDLPALESQIETRLLYGLALAEEDGLLNGTGTGGELEGLMTLAIATAGVTAPVAPGAIFDAVAKAYAEIGNAGYRATGVVLNPADFVTAAATPSAGGVYPYFPGQIERLTLWGLPLVLSSKMAVGQFLAGAFNPGCQLFDREEAAMQLAYQDRDNFVKNLVTARAEERLALAIYQPGAFRKAG